MNKFLESFNDKKFRYGTFSTLTIVIVMAILLFINLIVGQLNISFDLTKEKLYSLSDESKQILQDINIPITIYALFPAGATDAYFNTFRELLNQYNDTNKNLKVEYKDPYVNPQFLDKYTTANEDIPVGSIIVEGTEKFKIISVDKLVSQGFDSSTYQTYVESIDLEPQVTNAIRYVMGGNSVIYRVQNHNEQIISTSLTNSLELSNCEVRDVNLITTDIPEDCSILFITSPERDWSSDEVAKVQKYLDNNGRAIFFADYASHDFPNFYGLIASYGIEVEHAIVFEGNKQNYFQDNPIYIIPNLIAHDITNPIIEKNYLILAPMSLSLKEMDIKKSSLTIEQLLTSTSSAYAKTGENVQSINKEPDDISGPFTLSTAITDSDSSGNTAKIVVVGTSSVLNDSINSYVQGTNHDFVVSAIKWLDDRQDDIYISPKSTDYDIITMNSGQALLLIIFSVIVLPGLIFIYGIFVWFRRRNG